ncbi:hypothetical protein SAMN05421578_10897 [Paenibacillus macquariensis]|uniref:Uncharacterized protein n=1 Tax=Paenibacillus macquariensis TaxID=948756 RepID=A0ABY1K2W3_9BACL|nr:hypothetical protein SAMN05421578_10897 [Paenibacillus macquariensis]
MVDIVDNCDLEAGEFPLFSYVYIKRCCNGSGFVTIREPNCGILICYDVNGRFPGDATREC